MHEKREDEQCPDSLSLPTPQRGWRQGRYVYLLCLWTEPRRDQTAQPLWRFSLEEVRTGARYGFGDWQALLDFLREKMGAM